MRLDDEDESDNVIDARGESGGLGGGFPILLGGGRMGLGTLLVLVVLGLVFGINPAQLLNNGPVGGPTVGQPQPVDNSADTGAMAGPDDAGSATPISGERFVRRVLRSTEKTWATLFETQLGAPYPPPRLTLFSRSILSGCGPADAGMGPFYCPANRMVYLDDGFFAALSRRFGAPGDFAAAYVIAHEVGHHVENVTGVLDRADRQGPGSVAVELAADCLAGVWAHHNPGLLEPGDLEEGLQAAAAVGDDRLQRQAGQAVNPEGFTHGSSAQRMAALRAGLGSGQIATCLSPLA